MPGVPPSSPFVSSGGELRLTNPGQLELLRGMAGRGIPLRQSVRGSSMAPFIRDQDVVTIAPMNGRAPRLGDVVAFALPGNERMAVHRVVARVGAGWLMHGDNCPEPDGVVASDDVLGRVVRVERGGRDVHLGLGAQGAWLATLQRCGWLARARAAWRAPRLATARALRAAQGLPLYRRAGRRLAPHSTIAEATKADLAAVQRRLAPGVPSQELSANPGVTRWVARRGAKVVGFVELVHHPEEHAPWVGYWLFSLLVWGPYRGLGVGEALTRRVIAEAVAQGATELLLAVYEDDARAVRFYWKLGFERVTVPALEPLLAAETAPSGRRRVVLRKRLEGSAHG